MRNHKNFFSSFSHQPSFFFFFSKLKHKAILSQQTNFVCVTLLNEPDSETFEIKDSPIVTLEDDPSLSGLVAKRLVSETASEKVSAGGPNVVAEKAVVSLAGGDQREQTLGGVAKSVAISEGEGRSLHLLQSFSYRYKVFIVSKYT